MNRRKFLKLLPTSAGTAIVATKVESKDIIPNPKPWCEDDDVNDFIKVANSFMQANGHSTKKSKDLKLAIERNEVIE